MCKNHQRTCKRRKKKTSAVYYSFCFQKTAKVSCRQLDLCSLRNVKQFAEQYRQESLPLHYLILNAGILNSDFRLTEDGFEEMFQVNYLAQAYLTFRLILPMTSTKTNRPPRIIAISCESHRVE